MFTLTVRGLYAYGIVGKARWAHLSTSHNINPEPLGSAHLAVPNDAVYIFSYEYPSETANLNCAVQRKGESARWADLNTSRGESQQHECEKDLKP